MNPRKRVARGLVVEVIESVEDAYYEVTPPPDESDDNLWVCKPWAARAGVTGPGRYQVTFRRVKRGR